MRNAAIHPQPASERGAALIVALMAMLLMSALGLALVLTTATETMISSNYREGREGLYAAEAGIERAIQDLIFSDWNDVLSGNARSAFADGVPGERTLPSGLRLNLIEVANLANCGRRSGCTQADLIAHTPDRPWAENNPVWQLYAYGPLSDLVPDGTIDSLFYVVVMIGDDPSETDGDPLTDGAGLANPGRGVLTLRAEAFGPRGARRVIEATVARSDATEQEGGYVGQLGHDERNRGARRAPIDTPGRALTNTRMQAVNGGSGP
jgi:Tfp pilus assembly protein PilX